MFEKLSLNKLLFLLFCFKSCQSILGAAAINNKDGPYDPITISIPKNVWKQAFKPTPVLKSAATIVIPIHVSNDEYDDESEDDIEANENDVANDELMEEETSILNSTPATLEDSAIALSETNSNRPVEEDLPHDDRPVNANDAPVTGQVFRFPCSCVEGQCGCCTGTLLQTINLKACSNISFVPEDFVFDVRLSVNNNTMVRRRVSASDPPPICFNPRRAPFVRVCAEISNIRIRNNNAYACMDINADIGGFEVYSASFSCFGLGASGVQTGLKPKPVSSGPTPVNLFGNNNRDENNNGPGLLGGLADGILSGGGGGNNGGGFFGGSGLFGGAGGGSDADDDEGPFGAIGDAFDGLGDFLDAK